MPETAEELYRRALESADADRRLPMPPVAEWETFPFEGEMRVRPLRPPGDEPPRAGEDPADCWRCRRGDEDAIWSDSRWLVTPLEKPSGLPVIVILQPREHSDLGALPPELAAELGPRALAREPRNRRALACRGRRYRSRPAVGGDRPVAREELPARRFECSFGAVGARRREEAALLVEAAMHDNEANPELGGDSTAPARESP